MAHGITAAHGFTLAEGAGVGGVVTAAHAVACWALACVSRFCILTPSHGMSLVSLSAMAAPKPHREAQKLLGTDSCPLPHPTLTTSTLSAIPQPGRLQQEPPKSVEEHLVKQ